MSLNLNLYAEDLNLNRVQYVIIDKSNNVLESCDSIIKFNKNESVSKHFPFFITFETLVTQEKEESYLFSCIHFNIDKQEIICDVILKTYEDKSPLIIIQDFTSHYNDYQLTSQERNESVINKEKLAIQNLFLKSQEDFKNKFIANFSYELREPLTSIITFSEFLKETELDYQQKNYLDLIQSSSIYLKQILGDILLLSTLKAKGFKLEKDIFNLNDFLTKIAEEHFLKAKEKGLKFNFIANQDSNIFLESDSLKLTQILGNLISNAIQFTTKGEVTLSATINQVRARKQNITFSIKDTGCGIPKNELTTIFESFSKKAKSENKNSMGLGLSITKELVNLFKGQIEVSSTVNKGSEFTVNLNLPIAKKAMPTKDVDYKNLLENKPQIKILLIEDSEMIQMSLFKIFSKLKNINLDILTDIKTFTDTIEINDYTLILMDINLKNANGLDLVKKVRAHRHRTLKKTPIIAITSNVLENDLKKYKKAGINSTIKKPFTKEELYEALLLHLD